MRFYERRDQLQRFAGLVAVANEYGAQGQTHYFTYAYMRMVQEEMGTKMGIRTIPKPILTEKDLEERVIKKYNGDL